MGVCARGGRFRATIADGGRRTRSLGTYNTFEEADEVYRREVALAGRKLGLVTPKGRDKMTAEALRELLDYQPETGEFRWRWSYGKYKAGSRAGSITDRGYRTISIGGVNYRASRLAVLYVTGAWPPEEVDHRNCDRSDDRYGNLICCDRSQNLANKRVARTNKLGIKGVGWQAGKYVATISKDGRQHYLGRFFDLDAARCAYARVAIALHGEFARVE
jgi:hypothetical protein